MYKKQKISYKQVLANFQQWEQLIWFWRSQHCDVFNVQERANIHIFPRGQMRDMDFRSYCPWKITHITTKCVIKHVLFTIEKASVQVLWVSMPLWWSYSSLKTLIWQLAQNTKLRFLLKYWKIEKYCFNVLLRISFFDHNKASAQVLWNYMLSWWNYWS